MNPNDTPSSQNDMSYKRINARQPFQEECILSNGFGLIRCKTVDASKMGVGVWVNEIIPLKKGNNLFIKPRSLQDQFLAQVRWIEQDVYRNKSRLGLQLSTSIID